MSANDPLDSVIWSKMKNRGPRYSIYRDVSSRSRRRSSMTYTVMFNPSDADYEILQRLGDAHERNKYPVVIWSGFQSREDAQEYIDTQWSPAAGKSRTSYFIVEESKS
jgi:hypothetical protein